MHWQALGGTDLTNGQGLVLRAHPLLRPGVSGSTKFDPPTLSFADLVALSTLPEGWCGTCLAPSKGRSPDGSEDD